VFLFQSLQKLYEKYYKIPLISRRLGGYLLPEGST